MEKAEVLIPSLQHRICLKHWLRIEVQNKLTVGKQEDHIISEIKFVAFQNISTYELL